MIMEDNQREKGRLGAEGSYRHVVSGKRPCECVYELSGYVCENMCQGHHGSSA